MNENFLQLKNIFTEIKNRGWIQIPTQNKISQGVFFEQLIQKPIENFEIPDFEGIEIKTHLEKSKSYITLFNASPEGDSFFEIARICNHYGYPHSIFRQTKILQGDVKSTKKEYIGNQYQFRITVNYKKNKIILYIYDRNNKVVDQKSFWSFSLLEEKLYRKLRYLAVIDAKKKIINNQTYYRYDHITLYQLKSFEQFLKLIEDGIIIITFTVGVFLSGKRKGQIHNHGTAFRIAKEHLGNLFNSVEI